MSPSTPATREPGRSLYAVLADGLRAQVLRGEWPPGSAIPAEQALAASHGVALGTMRRALQQLVDEGLIERVHGRGSFVRGQLAGSTLLRFFRFGVTDGQVPTARIVSRRRVSAPVDVARQLGLAPRAPVLYLQRLRLLGGVPCLVEDLWLPLPTFEALAEGDVSDWGDLLYPLFAARCGVHVHRAVDEISFAPLSATQARLLERATGHPGARVDRAAHDIAGHCVEVRRSHGDAHAFHYTVTIT